MPPQTQEALTTMSSDLQEPLLNVGSECEPTQTSTEEVPSSPNDTTTNDDNNNNNTATDVIEKDIVLPACCCMKEPKRVNHNVLLNLVLCVVYGISGSLWNGTAYAAYLKKIARGKNGPLGDVEAVQGLASLLTALPVGYVADKIGRAKVLRAGGVLLLITTAMQIFVLEWVGTEEDDNGEGGRYDATVALWIMGVIMAFFGIGDGLVNGPMMALYADSTPEGERSTFFNYLFVCYMVASACGPLVSIILFQTLGDVWDLWHLRLVIYIGLGIEIFNAVLMLFFDDRKALDEGEENSASSEGDDEGCNEDENDRDNHRTTGDSSPSSAEIMSQSSMPNTELLQRQKWIPYIVFSQGLIFAVGSGMTVKFFPLFFKDEVGMSPSQVQIIYCIVPIVMSIASTLCTKLASSGFGRVQAMLLYSVAGVLLLYSMVFFKKYLDVHPVLLVPIYILRTTLMNASYPIQESILMDFVPREERARWKSLDSVASFGWCGSAAFGGWLADKYDYTYTFLITAILQTIGIAVWCLLLPLVPRTEGSRTIEENGDNNNEANTNSETNTNSLVPYNGYSSLAEEEVAEMERSLGVPVSADSDGLTEPLLSSASTRD